VPRFRFIISTDIRRPVPNIIIIIIIIISVIIDDCIAIAEMCVLYRGGPAFIQKK